MGGTISVPSDVLKAEIAENYRLDPTASTLHILVYRGGAMARLGHNHVISSHNISGSIWRGESLDNSGFSISVPVNTLIVDGNEARASEGDDFPLNISDGAKESTKTNMLRDTQLNGARYPYISIESASLLGSPDAPKVVAALRIKDQTRQIELPVMLQSVDGKLRIKGSFEIKQTDFGITPVSVALGALQVQDSVKIKFELVGTTGYPTPKDW